MDKQQALEKLASPHKSRPLSETIEFRTARTSDIDSISTLLVNGISLHAGGLWSGAETRHEWLARIHGDRQKFISEEIRIATQGHRIIGAFALVGVVSREPETWIDSPASLRFFALGSEFLLTSLVHLMLGDALNAARRMSLENISVELSYTKEPLVSAFKEFGFRKSDRSLSSKNGLSLEFDHYFMETLRSPLVQ